MKSGIFHGRRHTLGDIYDHNDASEERKNASLQNVDDEDWRFGRPRRLSFQNVLSVCFFRRVSHAVQFIN